MSQSTCPACGEAALVQTSTRRALERMRRFFTSNRPHRCRKCGWTGWAPAAKRNRHAHAWTVERDPPDLGTLDAALTREADDERGTGTTASDVGNSPAPR
jgi:predicted RNA-binding Zn-ribbon protein involved in translation (DUF1610 family)